MGVRMISFETRKAAANIAMIVVTGLAALVTTGTLLGILGYLVWHGAHSLNWAFFTELPAPVGEAGGGMANAMVGSGKVLALATLLGLPVGFLGGIFLSEYASAGPAFVLRYVTDLLNGVPSIVIGIVAYALVVKRLGHFSTFAGGIALGVMIIPIAVRSTEEYLHAVPQMLREGGLALGRPKWRVIATVVVPAAFRGILSGVMLDLARVAGETAPLLFTALNNQFWSPGWNQPTATLPVMIFTYAIAPYPDWHQQAWAAGFVLLMVILVVNILARLTLSLGRAANG
jgi:phosphate transport system permease protein